MSNARTLANTINSSSQIVVPSGGIAFTDLDSSNDEATANKAYVMGQDGYEAGTFTPTFTTSGTMTVNYSEQLGRYTKVGNLVHITITLFTSNVTITSVSDLFISGLPFTPIATGDQETVALSIGRFRRWTLNRTCNTVAVVAVNSNSSLQLFNTPTADINETYVQNNALKTGAFAYGNAIDVAGTYITA